MTKSCVFFFSKNLFDQNNIIFKKSNKNYFFFNLNLGINKWYQIVQKNVFFFLIGNLVKFKQFNKYSTFFFFFVNYKIKSNFNSIVLSSSLNIKKLKKRLVHHFYKTLFLSLEYVKRRFHTKGFRHKFILLFFYYDKLRSLLRYSNTLSIYYYSFVPFSFLSTKFNFIKNNRSYFTIKKIVKNKKLKNYFSIKKLKKIKKKVLVNLFLKKSKKRINVINENRNKFNFIKKHFVVLKYVYYKYFRVLKNILEKKFRVKKKVIFKKGKRVVTRTFQSFKMQTRFFRLYRFVPSSQTSRTSHPATYIRGSYFLQMKRLKSRKNFIKWLSFRKFKDRLTDTYSTDKILFNYHPKTKFAYRIVKVSKRRRIIQYIFPYAYDWYLNALREYDISPLPRTDVIRKVTGSRITFRTRFFTTLNFEQDPYAYFYSWLHYKNKLVFYPKFKFRREVYSEEGMELSYFIRKRLQYKKYKGKNYMYGKKNKSVLHLTGWYGTRDSVFSLVSQKTNNKYNFLEYSDYRPIDSIAELNVLSTFQKFKLSASKFNRFGIRKYYLRLRKFLANFYGNLLFKKFKTFYYLSKKKKRDRTFFFVTLFERLLSTVLLRMGFTKKIKDSCLLIKYGLVFVNNKKVFFKDYLVKDNDLIQINFLKTFLYTSSLKSYYLVNLERRFDQLKKHHLMPLKGLQAAKKLRYTLMKNVRNLHKFRQKIGQTEFGYSFGYFSQQYIDIPPHVIVNFRIMAGIFLRAPQYFLEDSFLNLNVYDAQNDLDSSLTVFWNMLLFYHRFSRKF